MAFSLTYFELLCNLTVLVVIVFTALSYATGLFYLAELAEEYPTTTKRVIVGLIATLALLHCLAFLLSPLSRVSLLLGLLTHASYYRLTSTFPYLPLTSPTFFLSLALLFASQVSWYLTLQPPPPTPYSSYTPYSQPNSPYYRSAHSTYTSPQVMAFFLLFIYLVPLTFFVTGSVSSQALPSMGERLREGSRGGGEDDGGEGKGKKGGGRWTMSTVKRWWNNGKEHRGGGGEGVGVRGGRVGEGGGSNGVVGSGGEGDDYVRRAAQAYGVTAGGAATSSPWYPEGDGRGEGYIAAAAAAPTAPGTSEGEWMGQLPPGRPVYMRQRSHVS